MLFENAVKLSVPCLSLGVEAGELPVVQRTITISVKLLEHRGHLANK